MRSSGVRRRHPERGNAASLGCAWRTGASTQTPLAVADAATQTEIYSGSEIPNATITHFGCAQADAVPCIAFGGYRRTAEHGADEVKGSLWSRACNVAADSASQVAAVANQGGGESNGQFDADACGSDRVRLLPPH